MAFTIVILTGKPGSMRQAESFLRNRKWNIFSTPTLRDCIAAVVKMRPDFVLIAADHPNRKVKTLPKLLAQAIQVKIIAFCEQTNGVSMGALNEMKMEYNLYPPVSGPAIERMCLKIRKEEEDEKNGVVKQRDVKAVPPSAAEQIANRAPVEKNKKTPSTTIVKTQTLDDFENFLDEAATAPANEVFVAKGSDSKPGSIVQPGMGAGDPLSAGGAATGIEDDFDLESELSALVEEDNRTSSGSAKGTNLAYMPTQENNSKTSSNGYVPPAASSTDAASRQNGNKKKHYSEIETGDDNGANGGEKSRPTFEAPDFKDRTKAKATLDVGEGKSAPSNTPAFDADGNPLDPFAADWHTDEKTEAHEQNDNVDQAVGVDHTKGKPGYHDGGAVNREQQTPPVIESAAIPDKNKDIPRYKQDPRKYPDSESIFVRGAQQALDEASRIANPLGEYQELKDNTQVACLTIESKRFSGYLLAAMGKNQKIDQTFMKTVRDKLSEFLRSHGEVIQEGEPMELTLQEVQFEDWAISQAEFLRKSVHGSSEVAMAFFPSKETSAKLEKSVTDTMLKMSLEELKDDVPVEFDLFIYMPSNNRFLLYTPQGRPIYGEQRGRLREKGVTHIHLRAEASGQVKKYRAQVFLNDKIAELKGKRRKTG